VYIESTDCKNNLPIYELFIAAGRDTVTYRAPLLYCLRFQCALYVLDKILSKAKYNAALQDHALETSSRTVIVEAEICVEQPSTRA
jgi:hypothetical protein